MKDAKVYKKAAKHAAIVFLVISAATAVVYGGVSAASNSLDRDRVQHHENQCTALSVINQCFSDPMCTRTSNDYANRALLEQKLGDSCEVTK